MYGFEWWEIVLYVVLAQVISMFLRGVIQPRWVREKLAPTELNPYLKPKTLPFDKNLAAIGVIEPEFRTEIDSEAHYQQMLAAVEPGEDYEVVEEMGGKRYIVMHHSPKARLMPEPPKITTLHWKNTLAE